MNATSTLRRETFPASAATTLRLTAQEADITVRHEPTDTAVVEVSAREEVDFGPVDITASGDEIVVRVPPLLTDQDGRRGLAIDLGFVSFSLGDARVRGLRVDVTLPERACLVVGTKSGDVQVSGTSGRAVLRTGSGDISLEHADELETHCGSGDVVVGRVVGDAEARSGSGDVVVRHASGTFAGGSGSGDLRVERFDGGTITLRAASGDIHVGVPRGVPVWQDVTTASGDVLAQLEQVGQPGEGEPFITVRATTASGDITLVNV